MARRLFPSCFPSCFLRLRRSGPLVRYQPPPRKEKDESIDRLFVVHTQVSLGAKKLAINGASFFWRMISVVRPR